MAAPDITTGPLSRIGQYLSPEVRIIVQQGDDGAWRDRADRVWDTGLIGSYVRFDLPDLDVFEIDVGSLGRRG